MGTQAFSRYNGCPGLSQHVQAEIRSRLIKCNLPGPVRFGCADVRSDVDIVTLRKLNCAIRRKIRIKRAGIVIQPVDGTRLVTFDVAEINRIVVCLD